MKKEDKKEAVQHINFSRREFLKLSASGVVVSAVSVSAGCSMLRSKPDGTMNEDCMKTILAGKAAGGKQVFEDSAISGMRMNNRIIRSATAMGLADKEGRPTDLSVEKHAELAQGGVGAIIVEGTAVLKNGMHGYLNPQLFDRDDFISDYKKLTKAAHQHNTPMILQAFHAGRQTRSAATGQATVAPSPIKDVYYNEATPEELTELQILEIIDSFVRFIERSKKADFDGVQLNAAHGYLLSEFLSPEMNQREDRWGGSTENRFRIIREILEKSKKRVGNYPILIKLNAYDAQSGGMRLAESVTIAKLLENTGCDAIEVSCGVRDDGFSSVRIPEIPLDAIMEYSFRTKDQPFIIKDIMAMMLPLMIDLHKPVLNYNVCAARTIKEQVNIPVIVVGGIRDLPTIEQLIRCNATDYVAMSRPFIIEPGIVNSFKSQQQTVSECVSCGLCAVCMEMLPTECQYGRI